MSHPNDLNPNDPIDRLKLKASEKLEYICTKAAEAFGRDPRGGGFAFVGRPRTIGLLLEELPQSMRQLQRPVVIGTSGSDIIMWWKQIPVIVRHSVKDDNLWVVPVDLMRDSIVEDRRVAAEMRLGAHRNTIRVVQ